MNLPIVDNRKRDLVFAQRSFNNFCKSLQKEAENNPAGTAVRAMPRSARRYFRGFTQENIEGVIEEYVFLKIGVRPVVSANSEYASELSFRRRNFNCTWARCALGPQL